MRAYKIGRDAITGRFISVLKARSFNETSTVETILRPYPPAKPAGRGRTTTVPVRRTRRS